MPRTEASVATWGVEGRTGIAVHADRSLRRSLAFGPDTHAGFDALWMAVNDLGYVDRRLWDNAGTIEAGPWVSVTNRSGDRVWRGRAGVRGGGGGRKTPPRGEPRQGGGLERVAGA